VRIFGTELKLACRTSSFLDAILLLFFFLGEGCCVERKKKGRGWEVNFGQGIEFRFEVVCTYFLDCRKTWRVK